MPPLSFAKVLAFELPSIEKAINNVIQDMPSSVLPVVSHTLHAGGKRLRPLLTLLSARLFGKPDNNIYTLAAALELLHAATLLHDDVLDGADIRRKKPTAHLLFGKHAAILAGDALLAHACAIVASFNVPELVTLYAKAIVETTRGEIEEMALQGSLEHSQDVYLDIIRGKTAYLLRTACEMGAVYASKVCCYNVTDEEREAIATYGEEAGIAFQMVDDALDFAPSEQIGKPQGGDIREGKGTPSIVAYAQSLPLEEAHAFKIKFEAKDEDKIFSLQEAAEIAKKICELGYDEYGRKLAQEHFDFAKKSLEIFASSESKDLLLSGIDYLNKRTY